MGYCAYVKSQDSAVHLHLKDKGHFFKHSNVHIMVREDQWLERGVKRLLRKLETSPIRGGGM